ncbi:hypothetical protein [Flagellimonas allohymeniacidonis]|uniref:Uncharacterized protein n=1 Tax=Flagellimonas allohymeniacidonis TaxID=2517819 RepID=A0A4V2HSP2_9FLAO|nr:hypothetical protein [Allomuricauda hymeniacidonis]TAI48460.1 hypothetical protein EW142_01255 [Allomuricauda hymeniacidonis]
MSEQEYITNYNSEEFLEVQKKVIKGEYEVQLMRTGITKTIGIGDSKNMVFVQFLQTYLDNDGKEVAVVKKYVTPDLDKEYFDEFEYSK